MKYHYTYRITNIKLNKHYYGTRTSTNLLPKEDLGHKYFSSSSDKDFIKGQKENPEDYKYKIILISETRENAISLEIKLHNKFNVGVNENFYNKAKQTSTRFDTTGIKMRNFRNYNVSEETKNKIKIKRKLQIFSKETRAKMSLKLTGHPVSEETRRKIGIANSKKTRTELQKQHLRDINLGNIASEETKNKISAALTKHYRENKRTYIKVCCLICKNEIAFNRINVHQKSKKCISN